MTERAQDLDSVQAAARTCEGLYREFRDRLYTFSLSVTLNAELAQDITQDAFMKLFSQYRQGAQVDNPEAYLIRTARNLSINAGKRRNRDESLHDRYTLRRRDATEPALGEERATALRSALAKLPEEQREVIFLKCFSDMSFQDIADRLEVPLQTAASRYRYGLEKMKSLLGEQ